MDEVINKLYKLKPEFEFVLWDIPIAAYVWKDDNTRSVPETEVNFKDHMTFWLIKSDNNEIKLQKFVINLENFPELRKLIKSHPTPNKLIMITTNNKINIKNIIKNNMKLITVYLDNVPTINLQIHKNLTINNIKSVMTDKFGPNINIRMFTTPQIELPVFNTNQYDNTTLESVFDTINNGVIIVTTVPVQPPQNIIPLTSPAQPMVKPTHGKIRIAQQRRGRSYPNVPGYETIPAWSRGAGEWKQLSPFYLKFQEGYIFENFWQSFKVWEKVDKQNTKDWQWPAEVHVDANKNPNANWVRWHEALLKHKNPVRRPNGKAIPLYAYWNGQKLNTVDARKQIYIPYLKQLYRANPVYQKLLQKVKSGKNIILVEPDGPLLDYYPDGLEVNLDLLYRLIDVMNYKDEGDVHKYRPYGHGYVLAMTILEDLNK